MVLTRGRYVVYKKNPEHLTYFLILYVLTLLVVFFFSDQLPVSTKFDMRSDPGVVRNYGKLLVEMVSIVPDGVVCFFVSYSYMDGIIATWNETGILKVRSSSSLYHASNFFRVLHELEFL